MNPIQMIQAFITNGGNPQQLLMKAIGMSNTNPLINNLVSMAKQGDTNGVEQFARNYFKERGMDFDKEFSSFMSNFNKR